MIPYSSVGLRLWGLRQGTGKSQQLVADFCGISQAMLSRYEQGTRLPSGRVLLALCQFYGVGMDYLFGLGDVDNAL